MNPTMKVWAIVALSLALAGADKAEKRGAQKTQILGPPISDETFDFWSADDQTPEDSTDLTLSMEDPATDTSTQAEGDMNAKPVPAADEADDARDATPQPRNLRARGDRKQRRVEEDLRKQLAAAKHDNQQLLAKMNKVEQREEVASRRAQVALHAEGILKAEVATFRNRLSNVRLAEVERSKRNSEALDAAKRTRKAVEQHDKEAVNEIERVNTKMEAQFRQKLREAQKEVAAAKRSVEGADEKRQRAEALANRAMGALAHEEAEVRKQRGSSRWFEEQVAKQQEQVQNATTERALAEEARDAAQAVLEESRQNASNLSLAVRHLTVKNQQLQRITSQATRVAKIAKRYSLRNLTALHAAEKFALKAQQSEIVAEKALKMAEVEANKTALMALSQESDFQQRAAKDHTVIAQLYLTEDDLKKRLAKEHAALLYTKQRDEELTKTNEKLSFELKGSQQDAKVAKQSLKRESERHMELQSQLDAVAEGGKTKGKTVPLATHPTSLVSLADDEDASELSHAPPTPPMPNDEAQQVHEAQEGGQKLLAMLMQPED